MATNQTTIAQPTKLVVLQNGQRISKVVHPTMEAAEAEKAAYVKRLQESNRAAVIPPVIITNLLLG